MTAVLAALILAPGGTMPQAEYHAPRNWEEDTSTSIAGKEVPQNRVALIADPKGKLDLLIEGGPAIILVNGGKAGLNFTSCDGCLPMWREAKDSKGTWRPIEWLAVSECGNSYDAPSLKPGRMWTWPIPTESGSFPTQVRFALKAAGKKIVSNPYEDRIDPAMFQLDETLRGSKFIRIGG